jgi:hypothetical protein
MKKMIAVLGMLVLVAMSWICMPQAVRAGVEWTITKQIELDTPPVDAATSSDGKLIFVLVPGEILVYSVSKDKVTDRIPVDKVFDRITRFEKDHVLVLTSSSAKTLKIVQVDLVHDIDLSGLPFMGPADAPVTIAVFSDYQ